MSVTRPLHILILEDNPIDADLVYDALSQGGIEFEAVRVENEIDFVAHLDDNLDLILSDYTLPGFNALQALRVLQVRGLDIPLIIVTGTVGEETVVECVRQGAADYLLKDRLARLGQAVIKALAEKGLRDEKRRAEAELRHLKEFNENIVQTMTEGVILLDADGIITFANPAAAEIGGFRPEQLVGLEQRGLALYVAADGRASFDAAIERREPGEVSRYEIDILSKDGTPRTVLISSSPRFEDGGFAGTLSVLTDITERKRAEERLRRVNRTLAVLSDVNQAIVHIRTISELFEQICHIAVEIGGFRMVWIGLLDAETKRVNPVAYAGVADGYLEKFAVMLDDGLRGQGPTTSAFRTGEPAFVNDVEHDPSMAPLREDALRLGYRAVAAFPLKVAGEVRGTFSMYSDTPGFFDDEELKLLHAMAEDISYAMEFAEKEERRQQAESTVKRYAQRLELLHEIDLALIEGNSIPRLVGAMVHQLRQLIQCQRVNVTLIDEKKGDAIIFAVDASTDTPAGTGIRIPIPPGFQNDPAASLITVFDNFREVGASTPQSQEFIKEGLFSALRAPLIDHDRVIGSLGMAANTPGFFTVEHREIAAEIASQLTIAIRQLRLSEELAQRAAELEQNVTELRAAEAALQSNVETIDEMRVFLQTTLDAFPTNTVVLESDGTVINVNAAWIRFADNNSALSPTHYLGANYLTVCDTAGGPMSEQAAPAADGIRAVIEGRQDAFFLEYPCHSSTEERWFLMGVTPFPGTAPRRVVIVHINITERKQAENELQNAHDVLEQRVATRTAELSQAKERTEAIFNSTNDAIVVVGPDSLIAQKNPSFRSLFGYQPGEAVGQPLTALFAPDYVEVVTEALRHATADAQPTEVEVVARRNDGTLFDADTTISPIVGQDKVASGVVCSVHDVTVRNEIERDLQALNQLKTDFLSTAAHELRTPLTSIRGFSEILLTRQLDTDRQQRYTALINEQATQLGKLIDDLLDISRLEAKRSLSLNMEPINPADLIEEVVMPFRESTVNHRIKVEVLRDCPTLIGDPIRLSEVMNNLLSNAIKYSPKGGTVTVSVRQMPGELQVSVQDDGLGMTAEQLSHLFEKFYRANASNTAIPGTGLGLALCKLIVELHGGKIWAESQPEVGTTMYFTLPLPNDAK